MTLSLQPIVPRGFLLDWIGDRTVLSLPDVFWEPPIGNEVDEFIFLVYFLPSLPPIVLVCALVFFFLKVPKKRDKC